MKRLAILVLLATAACGSPAPPPATPVPPQRDPKPPATAPASREPLFVELAAIPRRWVAKYAPESEVEPDFFWVLVKVDPKTGDAAAKAKAQGLLERAKKEPFEKVAAEGSEDPGSKDKGGMYPASSVKGFVKDVQKAWTALKPGETSPVFKSEFGWAFVKKGPAPDPATVKQARDAKASELAKQLGTEMTQHLRNSPDFRAAIAEAVEQVLGDAAVADPDRPKVNVVDRERIKDAKHLSPAVKAGLGQFADHAHPGDVLDTPAADEDVIVVARAVAPPS